MRTLRLNGVNLWVVSPNGMTDYVDVDGFRTGEKVVTYSVPVKVRMSVYPSNGTVKTYGKGIAVEADYLAVSTEIKLKENDLLFKSDPTAEWLVETPWDEMEQGWDGSYILVYDTIYDYKVSNILESINGNRYGLKVKT